MSKHDDDHPGDASTSRVSKRARLQALLFTAGSIGTTVLTLGMLAETKLPRYQGG